MNLQTLTLPIFEQPVEHIQSALIGIKPDLPLSVSDWADKYRVLTSKSSSEAGLWRTDRTPYMREIMNNLSVESPIQKVVVMAGAQIGKSESGFNWMGYVMSHAPAPMLMVQPTLNLARKVSKQRIAPMIDACEVIKKCVSPVKSRDSGNTIMEKEFTGGILVVTGANSATDLRSMPIKYLFLDEVDAYPSDVDGEGSPVKLAEKRTTTFARRKILETSTPLIAGESQIERDYLASDQRRYMVPCPHCGNFDWMQWKNIKFENNDPATARLLCTSCGCLIEERFKTEMLINGRWEPTAESTDPRLVGYHLSSLYSPLGWKSWEEIVKEFLESKDNSEYLKTWTNTVLAETWTEEYANKVGADGIMERAEDYRQYFIPEGGLILTASVDVQDNRLAVKIKAWGEGEESWLIAYQEIFGDNSDVVSSTSPWAQVKKIVTADYEHASGARLKILATAVDTGGHFTHEAYMFCRLMRKHNVIAIKGSSRSNCPALGKASIQDVNYKGKALKKGIKLWSIGTDSIKTTIYSRLKKESETGAGVMHFPAGVDVSYYKMLTVEKQIIKYNRGFPKKVWYKKDNERNEALDCEVYAYAALQYVYTKFDRNTIWEQAKKYIDSIRPSDKLEKENVEPNPPQKPEKPANRSRIKARKNTGGFVKNW